MSADSDAIHKETATPFSLPRQSEDRQAERQRLAELIGGLLARHWLRQRQTPRPSTDKSARHSDEVR